MYKKITLEKQLELALSKWKQIIEYGKTLPAFIQETYWKTNKKTLDELELKIQELKKQL